MRRVAVIGGGTAGLEAARVAATQSSVTLFEARPEIPAPKRTWPSLITGGEERGSSPGRLLSSLGVRLRLGEKVTKVGQGGTVFSAGRSESFDSVIIATGSQNIFERPRGFDKKGVHLLSGPETFVSLGAEARRSSTTVVLGSGPLALTVAERLLDLCKSVLLLAPGGLMRAHLSAPLGSLVERAASARLVSISESRPERVLGLDRVEAVLAGGRVYPCDCFVMIPSHSPGPVPAQVKTGRLGGVLVDSGMRTSSPSLFAAGDCAEARIGSSSFSFMFEQSARLMGEVAGANAAGGRRTAVLSGGFTQTVFGTEVAFAGLSLDEARQAGISAREVVAGDPGLQLCSLVFDSSSSSVYGAQIVGKGASAWANALALICCIRPRLQDLLTYEMQAGNDISPLREAAREGLGPA